MILDTGICTVFRKSDTASPGAMPTVEYLPFWASWYGELQFETAPVWQTEGRESLQTDKRIRILQNNEIRQNDVVVLEHLASFAERSSGAQVFKVNRAFHGIDDDGPTKISDLSLEVVEP